MKVTAKYITTYLIDTKTNEKIFVSEEKYIEPKVENKKAETLINQDTIATAILYDKKLALSEEAVKILNCNIGDKINIRYEQCKNMFVPIIYVSTSTSGNKLSKQYAIAYSGENAKALSAYGKEFELIKFADEPLRFMLKSNTMNITEEDINSKNNNCTKILDVDIDFNKKEDDITNISNFDDFPNFEEETVEIDFSDITFGDEDNDKTVNKLTINDFKL